MTQWLVQVEAAQAVTSYVLLFIKYLQLYPQEHKNTYLSIFTVFRAPSSMPKTSAPGGGLRAWCPSLLAVLLHRLLPSPPVSRLPPRP